MDAVEIETELGEVLDKEILDWPLNQARLVGDELWDTPTGKGHAVVIPDVHFAVERTVNRLLKDTEYNREVSAYVLMGEWGAAVAAAERRGAGSSAACAALRALYGVVVERIGRTREVVKVPAGRRPNWTVPLSPR